MSHSPAVFKAFRKTLDGWTEPQLIDTLFAQLKAEMVIYDRNDRKNRVVLQPHDYTLGSGHTFTTAINSFANQILIGHLLDSTIDLKLAAAQVGYEIDVKEVSGPEEMQFLKHSAVFLESLGIWQPILNLGVLLRSSGRVKLGDLPGRGDLRTRARNFHASMVNSMYSEVSCPWLDTFRRIYGTTVSSTDLDWIKIPGSRPKIRITDEQFTGRYAINQAAVLSALTVYSSLDVFTSYTPDAFLYVLEKDYGIKGLPPPRELWLLPEDARTLSHCDTRGPF
jgi:hypothetical protein